MTLSEMLKKLPQAFTEKYVKVHLIWVSCFFNVWDFFDKEHMGGFTGITQAHSFQVGLNCDGEVSVWYKSWSRDRIWKPFLRDHKGDVVWSPGESPMPTSCPRGISSFFKKPPDHHEIPILKGLANGVIALVPQITNDH